MVNEDKYSIACFCPLLKTKILSAKVQKEEVPLDGKGNRAKEKTGLKANPGSIKRVFVSSDDVKIALLKYFKCGKV